MELICATLYKLRKECNFQGYIHVKAIPGASQELIQKQDSGGQNECESGIADSRELETSGTTQVKKNILAPMRLVQEKSKENRQELTLYKVRRVCACRPEYTDDHRRSPETDYQILRVAESLYQNLD